MYQTEKLGLKDEHEIYSMDESLIGHKKGKELSIEADAEIERNIAFLYNIDYKEYKTIFKTIGQVEQMIPFRRLLNINSDYIFQNGI